MPLFFRKEYSPPSRLSAEAAKAEFLLPNNTLGNFVALNFDLAWGFCDNLVMPVIMHPGLQYPRLRPATREDIAEYKKLRNTEPCQPHSS